MPNATADDQGHPAQGNLQRLLGVVAILIGCILNPLNGSLAVTAYPQLSAYFDVPYAHMSAMVMYFMAATAVGQPLAGGLGDLLGRKNIFLAGIFGFTVASAMAAIAQTFDALLGWRIAQAAFSGVIMANGMALIAHVVQQLKGKVGDPAKALEAAKGWKFNSPRGPISIDPATRDIVMNEYLSEVVKGSDGKLKQKVIGTTQNVKDPCKELKIGPCAPK